MTNTLIDTVALAKNTVQMVAVHNLMPGMALVMDVGITTMVHDAYAVGTDGLLYRVDMADGRWFIADALDMFFLAN